MFAYHRLFLFVMNCTACIEIFFEMSITGKEQVKTKMTLEAEFRTIIVANNDQ